MRNSFIPQNNDNGTLVVQPLINGRNFARPHNVIREQLFDPIFECWVVGNVAVVVAWSSCLFVIVILVSAALSNWTGVLLIVTKLRVTHLCAVARITDILTTFHNDIVFRRCMAVGMTNLIVALATKEAFQESVQMLLQHPHALQLGPSNNFFVIDVVVLL